MGVATGSRIYSETELATASARLRAESIANGVGYRVDSEMTFFQWQLNTLTGCLVTARFAHEWTVKDIAPDDTLGPGVRKERCESRSRGLQSALVFGHYTSSCLRLGQRIQWTVR